MQAVRCEACGLKALVAASTCPHCGHLLDIRNSFGELLPLVYCTTCDVSYPARDGACRWCGSKPEKVNLRPHIWKGVGALVFVGMATAAFLTREDNGTPAARVVAADSGAGAVVQERLSSVVSGQSIAAAAPIDSSGTVGAIAPSDVDDTTALRIAITDTATGIRPFAADSPPPLATSALTAVDSPSNPPSAAAPDSAVSDASVIADRPRAVIAEDKPKPKLAAPPRNTVARKAPPRRAVGWSNAVARSWATVRAAPSRSSRLLGSVGPDTHVQIGEVRGHWRRIRLRGMTGWVERGQFTPRRVVATQRRAAPY
jgi:hypothetical protein